MGGELERLTRRELEVAALVADGLSDRQIGAKLFVSRRTAEWHVEQIRNKLGLQSRTQIAAHVARAKALGSSIPITRHPEDNLPTQLSALIGRHAELNETERILRTTRLLTLTGVAGVGKTRLALALASRVLEGYPNRAWFVDLAAIQEKALVPRAVATTLGARDQHSLSLELSLVQLLRNRRQLVILDNCEHVIDSVASLAAVILGSCRGVTLLATSREALRVPGEISWRVPPLIVPDVKASFDLEMLMGFEAIGLFVERARCVAPAFQVTESNALALIQLCEDLDGIPLAIELAAARSSLMSPAEMVSHVQDRFRLLVAGSRTAPSRQRTMESAISWSHDLLDGDERLLFRRLSVFAGSASLESIEAICSGEDVRRSDIVSVLGRLVDKSLVLPISELGGDTRYRVLETLRQYGTDRLEESGELMAIKGAHLKYFLNLAEVATPHLFTTLNLLQRMDQEQSNFRLALGFGCQNNPSLALRLAVALWQYWNIRGHLVEGREALAKALSCANGDPEVRCQALARAGQFAWYAGDEVAESKYADEAIALGRTIAPSVGLTMGLFVAGAHAIGQGDSDEAQMLLYESIATAQATGVSYSSFAAAAGLYYVRMQTGDVGGGHALADETLRLFDESHAPFQYCIFQCLASMEECNVGDFARARDYLSAGLRVARDYGFNYWGGVAVRSSSYFAAMQRDYESCWRLVGASHVLRDRIPFASRGMHRAADHLLDDARIAVSPGNIAVLMEEGERMDPGAAFDLALATVAGEQTIPTTSAD